MSKSNKMEMKLSWKTLFSRQSRFNKTVYNWLDNYFALYMELDKYPEHFYWDCYCDALFFITIEDAFEQFMESGL